MKTILGRNIGGCVVDHSTTRNERQLDTIRVRVMERSIWRQGRKIVRGMRSKGSINFRIVRNYAECAEVCEVVRRVGNRVAEYGFEYFCPDYVSKIGVSVMEHNNQQPNTTYLLTLNKSNMESKKIGKHKVSTNSRIV